ncbi:gamma-tubulin complex component 5 [Caerostris extrusa]|uniref:Gamma-tubulin complex component n=1 Tax=Caerostris extrusa TaxID=172846 RepID=A0AAV4S210_CAEEX|nr:gamma-tubulin complex component 5 [Caerostris extrusa]
MILHILWKLLYQNSLQRTVSPLVKTLLKIFLKTCKPYFSFIEELMILGSFRDPYEEFLVNLRTLPRDLEDFFLKPFITDILCAGKSRELLNTIYSLRREESFQLQATKDDMYLKFIQILQKVLCRNTPKQICNSSKRLADLNKSEFFDPLLEESIFDFKTSTAKFFRPDINPAYRHVSPKLPECLYSEQIEKIQKILTELEPTRLKPLPVCIGKALNTCMEYAYFPVCRKITKSLKEDHCIVNHLSVMRKYFLMESGDLMFSFYSNIFHKIFYMKTWMDGSFLYSALQNAIFEDKENSERLCIFLNIENPDFNIRHPLSHLSALKLSYKVDWPVSIMLGPQVQLEYSQIFSFLLQIKCAKYLLDNLYCTSLCKKYPQNQTQLMKALLKTKFPREQKIHGMYILRMRLMFFVNGFHNYIMTSVSFS